MFKSLCHQWRNDRVTTIQLTRKCKYIGNLFCNHDYGRESMLFSLLHTVYLEKFHFYFCLRWRSLYSTVIANYVDWENQEGVRCKSNNNRCSRADLSRVTSTRKWWEIENLCRIPTVERLDVRGKLCAQNTGTPFYFFNFTKSMETVLIICAAKEESARSCRSQSSISYNSSRIASSL